jgi:DNA primase
VVVAFDNDKPGRRLAASTADLLWRDGAKAVVRHPPAGFKDVGEMSTAAARDFLRVSLGEVVRPSICPQ